VALFQAGEEGVTSDLLPLIMVVASEGRIEEEIFLTSFLWEEAKHVEFFRRWLDEVVGAHQDLGHYLTPSYRQLFLAELPKSLNALKTDQSTAAQIRASVTYNMIIEGVLAETGYHGFRESLESQRAAARPAPGHPAVVARRKSSHSIRSVSPSNRPDQRNARRLAGHERPDE